MRRVLNLHQLYAFMVSCRTCLPLPNMYLLLLLSSSHDSPLWARVSSLSRLHEYTQLNTLHSSGLLWMSYQLVARDHYWQHPTLTKRQTTMARTRNPSKRGTTNQRLRSRGRSDCLVVSVGNVILNCSIKCLLTHIMVTFYLKNAY